MQHDAAPQWSPARLAYGFYAVAATGAVIGQTWVAYIHVPWPPAIPAWVRIAAVLPFALCLELLAMALAAMADQRMRLGEGAYGFRIFSAMVATVAVGILVLGHWPHYYWSASFGILSTSAYLLWLLHCAARRRDTLRAAGKLADTAPDYGPWRRIRHPLWTARAAELACEGTPDPVTGQWRPLSLYESLHAAQAAIRADKRRPLVAHAVEQVVRADHPDPRMAEIAVRTLDLDRLATQLESLVDYAAWANRLAPAITVPTSTTAAPGAGYAKPEFADPRSRSAGLDSDRTVVRRRRVTLGPTAVDPTPALLASVLTHPTRADVAPDPIRPGLRAVQPVDDTAAGTHHLTPESDAAAFASEVETAGASAAVQGPGTVPVLTPGPGTVHDGVNPPPVPTPLLAADDSDADSDGESTDVSQTAAAVMHWRTRHPDMTAKQIAARVGCSARHVRRIFNAIDKPDGESAPEPDAARIRRPRRLALD